jgi:hypothetical protein
LILPQTKVEQNMNSDISTVNAVVNCVADAMIRVIAAWRSPLPVAGFKAESADSADAPVDAPVDETPAQIIAEQVAPKMPAQIIDAPVDETPAQIIAEQVAPKMPTVAIKRGPGRPPKAQAPVEPPAPAAPPVEAPALHLVEPPAAPPPAAPPPAAPPPAAPPAVLTTMDQAKVQTLRTQLRTALQTALVLIGEDETRKRLQHARFSDVPDADIESTIARLKG